MDTIPYLIIGGGVAGTSCAEAIRTKDKTSRVVIVTDEAEPLYSRILLSKPHFVLKKIPFENVYLRKHEWYTAQGIELRARTRVTKIDIKTKTVYCHNGTKLNYEKLLLAVGGIVKTLETPGASEERICYIRTLADGEKLMEKIPHTTHAVVIGSGFIGFEACDVLRKAGIKTTLVLRKNYFWESLLDNASCVMIENALTKIGVTIIKQTQLTSIKGAEQGYDVTLSSGANITCDLIVVGKGIEYPVLWLKDQGFAVNKGIVVNEYLETGIEWVWAAGDVAEFNDLMLGDQMILGNWVNAQLQGRRVGLNMTGTREPFKLVSSYTAQGAGLIISFVGDIRPLADRKMVLRGSPNENKYGRILLKNNKVIGATLINLSQEMGAISKMIEKGETILT